MSHWAGDLSAKLDTFAAWLLAGFWAAVALLLTSHEVSVLVPAASIRYGAKLFLAAVRVTVVEKYLSIIVAGRRALRSCAPFSRIISKSAQSKSCRSTQHGDVYPRVPTPAV
jgi:hypothetical protein